MKIEDIKKGMLVQFSDEVIFTHSYRNHSRDMSIVSFPMNRIGMIIGLSNKVTGHWHSGDSDAQGYISSIKTHKLVVVQIHPDQQRYYAPVYVRPEDCERIG